MASINNKDKRALHTARVKAFRQREAELLILHGEPVSSAVFEEAAKAATNAMMERDAFEAHCANERSALTQRHAEERMPYLAKVDDVHKRRREAADAREAIRANVRAALKSEFPDLQGLAMFSFAQWKAPEES